MALGVGGLVGVFWGRPGVLPSSPPSKSAAFPGFVHAISLDSSNPSLLSSPPPPRLNFVSRFSCLLHALPGFGGLETANSTASGFNFGGFGLTANPAVNFNIGSFGVSTTSATPFNFGNSLASAG